MKADLVQEHMQNGGGGVGVLELETKLLVKQEQLVNRVCHEVIVVYDLWKVMEQFDLYLLEEPTNKLNLEINAILVGVTTITIIRYFP